MLTEEILQNLKLYLSEFDSERLVELLGACKEKSYLLKTTGVPSRIFQHWKNLEITPPNEQESAKDKNREWVLLSFSNFIWVKVLDSLRKLGYPSNYIKQIKADLFSQENYFEGFKRTRELNPNLLQDQIRSMVNNDTSQELIDAFNEFLTNEKYFGEIEGNLFKNVTTWSLIVINAILFKGEEIGLRFYEDGTYWLYSTGWNIDSIQQTEKLQKPHIYISLTKLIIDIVSDTEKFEYTPTLNLLERRDADLLKKFNSNDFKTITIKYDEATGTKIIKTEKEKKVKSENIQDFIKNVVFNPYCKYTINVTKKGDLIIQTEKTKKIK